MSGTTNGGKLSAEKLTKKDPNYYSKIGKRGGSVSGIKKGFALMDKDKQREASSRGGKNRHVNSK